VIFDYIYRWLLEETDRDEVARMRRSSRFTGEGLRFGFESGEVVGFLEERGFVDIQDVSTEELKNLYFHGPNSERVITSGYAIASGRTK
jgi:O-methyltransferase involved in polyketide biosynthesis